MHVLHTVALLLWLASAAWYAVLIARARRRGEMAELGVRRRGQRLLVLEHVAFLTLLLSGWWLAGEAGLTPARARWFGLKVGLVVFLFLPLEAIHAYVAHSWIARGLRETMAPPFSKDLARGSAVQEMLFSLAAPLLGLSVPLVVWLSLARPR